MVNNTKINHKLYQKKDFFALGKQTVGQFLYMTMELFCSKQVL